MGQTPLLEVSNLSIAFETPGGVVRAVNDISFRVAAGGCLGVVGESGSGKSQTFRAIMGGLSDNGRASGSALFDGQNLLELPERELNRIRGNRIALVMQNTAAGLTPHMRVGDQLLEVLRLHSDVQGEAATRRVLEVMDRVRIPEARARMKMYPHEFSGGMRQRVMIALSLICGPEILIADEPTTALDVTVQAQILDIFDELRAETQMAIILITHDLGVLAGRADQVMVMYGGRIYERADVEAFFKAPWHPYSEALLEAIPRIDTPLDVALTTIGGQPPDLKSLPVGCAFAPRCPRAQEICRVERPERERLPNGRSVACHFGGHK